MSVLQLILHCSLIIVLSGYALIEEEVEQIQTSRRLRVMTKVFQGWQKYAAMCRPAREERARMAEEMAIRRKNLSLRKIIISWHSMAHGPSSRKAIMADYKRRLVRYTDNQLLRSINCRDLVLELQMRIYSHFRISSTH